MQTVFVTEVGRKASQIGESIAQKENENEDNQDIIDAAAKDQTKKLMEEVMNVFAQVLAAWKVNDSCNKLEHQARALVELVLKLRSATE